MGSGIWGREGNERTGGIGGDDCIDTVGRRQESRGQPPNTTALRTSSKLAVKGVAYNITNTYLPDLK